LFVGIQGQRAFPRISQEPNAERRDLAAIDRRTSYRVEGRMILI
jgi:hypothetical protein